MSAIRGENPQTEGTGPTEPTFEEALSELEVVVRALESGELTLDQAIDHFQTGMRLVQVCRERLHAAEQKVEVVLATEGDLSTRPFVVEE